MWCFKSFWTTIEPGGPQEDDISGFQYTESSCSWCWYFHGIWCPVSHCFVEGSEYRFYHQWRKNEQDKKPEYRKRRKREEVVLVRGWVSRGGGSISELGVFRESSTKSGGGWVNIQHCERESFNGCLKEKNSLIRDPDGLTSRPVWQLVGPNLQTRARLEDGHFLVSTDLVPTCYWLLLQAFSGQNQRCVCNQTFLIPNSFWMLFQNQTSDWYHFISLWYQGLFGD